MDGRGGCVCGAVGRTTARQQCSVVFQAGTGAENTGRACVGCGVKFFFFGGVCFGERMKIGGQTRRLARRVTESRVFF